MADPIRVRTFPMCIMTRGKMVVAWSGIVAQGDPETEDYLEYNGSGATEASAVKSAVNEWRRARRLYRRRAT